MKATQSILEEPRVRDRVHPLSIEAYHALGDLGRVDEKVELLRGIVVEKMSKSPLHCLICQRLADLFRTLAAESRDLLIRQEQPLTLSDSEPEPDIAVVRGEPERFALSHPRGAFLVVEVAISSVEIDREKAAIYAEAGIPEYWLARPAEKEIEVFTQPENGVYQSRQTLNESATLGSSLFPELQLSLAELFAMPPPAK